MENVVFCFYNRLSLRYGDVFCYPTVEFAKARIAEMARNPQNPVNLSEVDLCQVGTLDFSTGTITPCSPLRIPLDFPRSVDDVAHEVKND